MVTELRHAFIIISAMMWSPQHTRAPFLFINKVVLHFALLITILTLINEREWGS